MPKKPTAKTTNMIAYAFDKPPPNASKLAVDGMASYRNSRGMRVDSLNALPFLVFAIDKYASQMKNPKNMRATTAAIDLAGTLFIQFII